MYGTCYQLGNNRWPLLVSRNLIYAAFQVSFNPLWKFLLGNYGSNFVTDACIVVVCLCRDRKEGKELQEYQEIRVDL